MLSFFLCVLFNTANIAMAGPEPKKELIDLNANKRNSTKQAFVVSERAKQPFALKDGGQLKPFDLKACEAKCVGKKKKKNRYVKKKPALNNTFVCKRKCTQLSKNPIQYLKQNSQPHQFLAAPLHRVFGKTNSAGTIMYDKKTCKKVHLDDKTGWYRLDRFYPKDKTYCKKLSSPSLKKMFSNTISAIETSSQSDEWKAKQRQKTMNYCKKQLTRFSKLKQNQKLKGGIEDYNKNKKGFIKIKPKKTDAYNLAVLWYNNCINYVDPAEKAGLKATYNKLGKQNKKKVVSQLNKLFKSGDKGLFKRYYSFHADLLGAQFKQKWDKKYETKLKNIDKAKKNTFKKNKKKSKKGGKGKYCMFSDGSKGCYCSKYYSSGKSRGCITFRGSCKPCR